MTSVNPPFVSMGHHGGEADDALQLVTIHFGHRNPGPYQQPNAARSGEFEPMFLCELDGVWYPVSRQRTDGMGRKVPEKYATTRPLWLF